MSFREGAKHSLAQAWQRASKRSLYRTAQDFIALVAQVGGDAGSEAFS